MSSLPGHHLAFSGKFALMSTLSTYIVQAHEHIVCVHYGTKVQVRSHVRGIDHARTCICLQEILCLRARGFCLRVAVKKSCSKESGACAFMISVRCDFWSRLYTSFSPPIAWSVGPSHLTFWAAAPKGTKSCRTQGDFHLSVRPFVHSLVPPGPLGPEICPPRPEI